MFRIFKQTRDDSGDYQAVFRGREDLFYTTARVEVVRKYVEQKNQHFIDEAYLDKMDDQAEISKEYMKKKTKLEKFKAFTEEELADLGLDREHLEADVAKTRLRLVECETDLVEIKTNPYKSKGFFIPVRTRYVFEKVDLHTIEEVDGVLKPERISE